MSKHYRKPKHKGVSSGPVPFSEHVYELRRRLFYVGFSVLAGALAAYAAEQAVIRALLKPAQGEHFIYTSPIGGVDFLFRVCIYAGVVVGIPAIIYNFLRYIEPLFSKRSSRFIYAGTIVSGILALVGLAFGYFIGLPNAMHFLLHQSINSQVSALITVQSYTTFVIRYLLGSALMFQIPLVLLLINRIKPLKPKQLFRYERWVILGSFIIAALMDPTPRIKDQLVIAVPLIAMYQLSIGLVALTNRKSRSAGKEVIDAVAIGSGLGLDQVIAQPPDTQLPLLHHTPVFDMITAPEIITDLRSPDYIKAQAMRRKVKLAPMNRDSLISDFFIQKPITN